MTTRLTARLASLLLLCGAVAAIGCDASVRTDTRPVDAVPNDTEGTDVDVDVGGGKGVDVDVDSTDGAAIDDRPNDGPVRRALRNADVDVDVGDGVDVDVDDTP